MVAAARGINETTNAVQLNGFSARTVGRAVDKLLNASRV